MLFLLLIHIIHCQSIEILESGQIYSSSKSIGTLLYINLFNHLSIPIQISGVVDHCCISINHCIPVRLLGGDFGEWKSNKNRSMIFLWPGIDWQYVNENIFCQVSLLFGPRHHMTNWKLLDIKINYIPLKIIEKERQKRNIDSLSIIFKSIDNPFQINNSPYNIFPKCNSFLNIQRNHCENLHNLRQNFSFNSSSSFIPFNHHYLSIQCINGIQSNTCQCQDNFISIPINQKLYHPKNYIHQLCTHSLNHYQYFNLHLLIIITSILFILYLIILTISSIFICTYYRHKEQEEFIYRNEYNQNKLLTDQRFSLIEIASELQMNHNNSCTSLLVAD